MRNALRQHWREYLCEAAGLGAFMVSACVFGVLLDAPASPVRQAVGDPFVRRALGGLAMGLTAVCLIYSPLGQRSGAHLNPAFTLTFWRLGKVRNWDSMFYVLAQFLGGVAGVALAAVMLTPHLGTVQYVATTPGLSGVGAAFTAETVITFIQMTVVLHVSNRARTARYTGLFAASLVALYITFESPLSGMSMNPARTFGSAVFARLWTALWIYFTAPPLGMLLAAELYVRRRGIKRVFCAKLHHHNQQRCIFNCNFAAME